MRTDERKIQMKKILAVFLSALMLLSVAACGEPGASDTDIEMLASTGTLSYVATAISEVVTKESNGLRMSAVGTSGTEANVSQMQSKSDASRSVFMSSAATYRTALHGKGTFEGQEPESDIRLIAGFVFGVNGFVTLDPEIKTLEDLDGKTVAMVTDAMPLQACTQMFKNLNIDVEIQVMGFNDQFSALSDGLVDACMYLGQMVTTTDEPLLPVSALQEMVANQKNQVYAIPVPFDLIIQAAEDAGIADVFPYVSVMAQPGSLSEAQTDAFEVYGAVTGCLCAWSTMSDETAYAIAKTLCERVESLGDYYSSLENLTAEQLVSMLATVAVSEDEVHPGALQYYKEAGLWTAFEDNQ